MIAQYCCDPAFTRNWSALRNQFHFLLSIHHGIDGQISLTPQEMAKKMDCTRPTITKFIKRCLQENMLRVERVHGEDRYYWNHVVNGEKDIYIKQFPFLLSKEFRAEPIQVQYVVMYALYRGVYDPRHIVENLLPNLWHSTPEQAGIFNIYSEKELLVALEGAAAYLDLEIKPSAKPGIRKLVIRGLKEKYASQEALENTGEASIMEQLIHQYECSEFVSEESFINLMKKRKHLYTRYGAVGVKMFEKALQELAKCFGLMAITERNEFIQYFNGILRNVKEQMFPIVEGLFRRAEKAVHSSERIEQHLDHTGSASVNVEEVRHIRKRIGEKKQWFIQKYQEYKMALEGLWRSDIDEEGKEEKPKEEKPKDEVQETLPDEDPLQTFLTEQGLVVPPQTLRKWRTLDSEDHIKLAVKETLERPEVDHVVGYVTRVLENGFTPSKPKKKPKGIPSYIRPSIPASAPAPLDSISIKQQQEALELLWKLGEIDETQYREQLNHLEEKNQDPPHSHE